jgi:integrase
LLSIQGGILNKNIMQVSTRELSLSLRPSAQKWMRSAFGLLLEKKIISFNPQERQKARKRKPIIIPSRAAVKKLLTDSSLRERIACWLGAVCGMRIGEILALTYADVSKDWISVSKHITPDGVQDGLKRGLQRRIKMPRDLFSLLDVEKLGTSLPIIANARTGAPLSLGYTSQGILRTILDSYGIKRFHDLRHFAVSRLAERGVDILKVSRMIGHANVSTTLNIYGHLFGETIDLDFD